MAFDVTTARALVGAVGFAVGVLLAVYHRGGGEAERRVADPWVEAARIALVGAAAVGTLVWLIEPAWMAWSTLGLPAWARWGGAVLLVASMLGVWWAFAALGRNFATTLVVKAEHELVTHGPYRWVRHPMYTLGCAMFAGLMLVTGSWFVGVCGVAGMGVMMVWRVPKEEAMLAEEFGEAWRAYARRTGRFLPRRAERP